MLNGASKRTKSRRRSSTVQSQRLAAGVRRSISEGENSRSPAASVTAAAVHSSSRTLVEHPRLPSKPIWRSTTGWKLMRDVGLSLLVAAGLSTVVLAPWPTSKAASSGRVRGASITRPLTIPVTISLGTREQTVTTRPPSGALAVALGQAAGAVGGSLTYASRGQSIYLRAFLDRANDATGRWQVTVNDQPVNDVSLINLAAGDRVRLERQVAS